MPAKTPPKPEPTAPAVPVAEHPALAKLRRLADAVAILHRPASHLSLDDSLPPESLPALLDVLNALRFSPNDPNAVTAAASRFAGVVAGNSRHLDMADWLCPLLTRLDAAVAKCLGDGGSDGRVVPTSAFGTVREVDPPNASAGPVTVRYYAGILESLAPGHALLSLVSEDDAHRTSLDGLSRPALVLGPVEVSLNGYTLPVRPWYLADDVRRLTIGLRRVQKAKLAEKAEAERAEQRKRTADFRNSEIGRLREKLKVLEELERQGRLDELDPPGEPPRPAVLGAGLGPLTR
jgi:hypothetical protein